MLILFMKIVHLCLSAFFIDNYSYQENLITKYHAKQGHEVTVIASLLSFNKEGLPYYMDGPSEYVNNDGVKVIRIAYKKPFVKINRLLGHYEDFEEKLEDEHPDIIFAHNFSMVDASILKHYIVSHSGVVFYADNHADYINSGKNFLSKNVLHPIIWRHYAKMLEPYMIKCYGVTPMRCRFLVEMYHIAPQKVLFLPLGVDDDAIPADRQSVRASIRKELSVKEDDVLILTGGKIDKLKNIHILLEAIRQMKNSKIHLVICGVLTPEMSYLEEIIRIMPNIHYMGWCNANQVMNYMIAADCVCFPGTHSSLWEQSVGVGIPAIFKRWDEMDHVNVNGNCIFVTGEDVDELKMAISSMLEPKAYQGYQEKAAAASRMFLYSEISKKAISSN